MTKERTPPYSERIKAITEVTSEPQNVDWKPFRTEEEKAAAYQKYSGDKRKKLVKQIADGLGLWSLPDKFLVLDDSKKKLAYLVQFKLDRFFGKRGVTQIKLWRDLTYSQLNELPHELFFQYLMPMADCIVTDRQQTEAGQSFWKKRIGEAFAKGLHVYALDLNTKKAPELSIEEFRATQDNYWGDQPKYQALRLAISKDALW